MSERLVKIKQIRNNIIRHCKYVTSAISSLFSQLQQQLHYCMFINAVLKLYPQRFNVHIMCFYSSGTLRRANSEPDISAFCTEPAQCLSLSLLGSSIHTQPHFILAENPSGKRKSHHLLKKEHQSRAIKCCN